MNVCVCLCLEFKTSATRHLSTMIENLGESFSFSISSYFLLLNTRDFPIISRLIFFFFFSLVVLDRRRIVRFFSRNNVWTTFTIGY